MSDLRPGEVIERRDALIQFDQAWVDRCVAVLPELANVDTMLGSARRGIVYSGRTARLAAEEIEAVGATTGAHRLAHLFSLFSVLAEAPPQECEYVAPAPFTPVRAADGGAAEAGLRYIAENLGADLRLSEAARLAHMSAPTFSRYFQRASGRTFTEMVRTMRIMNACRLLARTDDTVAAISTTVGYRNLTNFNRQFKAAVGVTPRQYRALPERDRPNPALMP